MSRDLLVQLAEYGEHVRDAQRPIERSEVADSGPGDRGGSAVAFINDRPVPIVDLGHRRSSTRTRWWAGAAAAATLAIGIAGVAVLRSGEGDPGDQGIITDASTDTTVARTVPPASRTNPSASSADDIEVVVPADALGEISGGVAPTAETPLPNFEDLVLADSGAPPRMLPSVDDLPDSSRLDFLDTDCGDPICFRDARFVDADGRDLGGEWTAGQAFHIRHGFPSNTVDPLNEGFDLAVYAYPLRIDDGNGFDREPIGPTQRFTTDSIVRAETDACGPAYRTQGGAVTCELFVHDFPDGLPEGRWALWVVWEAPCTAWVDLGLTEDCTDPNEVMSFFSSGVDSPFYSVTSGPRPTVPVETATDPATGPDITQVGDWTRIDGLGISAVVGDGSGFFAPRGNELLRSVDGITWEEYTEPSRLFESVEGLFDPETTPDPDSPRAAVGNGRLVMVEDDQDSVTVHIVDPDGTQSTQNVPVVVPAPYATFHRDLDPGVHLLDDGRIVITASYSADEGLVVATGQTRAELGLDLFYSAPRPIVIVSGDGETWTQLEPPPQRIEEITTVLGGLVAAVGPVLVGPLHVSVSVDGAVWESVIDPESGRPLEGRPLGGSRTGNRAFVMGHPGFEGASDEGRIWEITIDGARLIAGGDASSEPLELFQRFHHGRLTAGGAGIAFVSAVDEEFVEPLPDGEGIRYSSDDGKSWGFEPFPDGVGSGDLTVGASTMVLTSHNRDGSNTLWVRDFPG